MLQGVLYTLSISVQQTQFVYNQVLVVFLGIETVRLPTFSQLCRLHFKFVYTFLDRTAPNRVLVEKAVRKWEDSFLQEHSFN